MRPRAAAPPPGPYLQRAKPDMIAYSEVRARTPAARFGPVPGVRLGSEWIGRGEAAVVGLHKQMMRVG
jgi:hypothetical protein